MHHKEIKSSSKDERRLVVVGGGTAALTYLYTHDIEPQYTSIIILGNRGYWEVAGHRLAQPAHILALPHMPGDEFIDPEHHNAEKDISANHPDSAYADSRDFQANLYQLERAVCDRFAEKGIAVHIVKTAVVKTIRKNASDAFDIKLQSGETIFANKVIVASGAGAERKLSIDQVEEKSDFADARILSYTEILRAGGVKQCKGKDVIIHGGGATAAWAVEVAMEATKPVLWVARSGLSNAANAGPRVDKIVASSESLHLQATIQTISSALCPVSKTPKLLVTVLPPEPGHPIKSYYADFIFNCIGQESQIPDMICKDIKFSLQPYLDNSYTLDSKPALMGWVSSKKDFIVIGAASATYSQSELKGLPPTVSSFMPQGGKVPTTIGGVVADVCALTKFMPFKQDPKTGKITLFSLNMHIMNATQLAVYFTGLYPCASAKTVNRAVVDFIAKRKKTYFSFSETSFMESHFGHLVKDDTFEIVRPTKPAKNDATFTRFSMWQTIEAAKAVGNKSAQELWDRHRGLVVVRKKSN